MSRYAAVISLGTQEESFNFVIRFLLQQMRVPLDLYVLYGSVGDPTRTNPQTTLDCCRTTVLPGSEWKASKQCRNSWALETSYWDAMELLENVLSAHEAEPYDSIFTCIIGGTKPMVAAITLAVQVYFPHNSYPVYVQGNENPKANRTDSIEVFEGPGIRDDQTILRILNLAHLGQFFTATTLSTWLPKSPSRNFLENAMTALTAWDDFDYATAAKKSEEAVKSAASMADDTRFMPLADCVRRIGKQAVPMSDLSKVLADKQLFVGRCKLPEWPELIRSTGHRLVIDALANAKRRLQQGRYTDAVLRGYRACECATQMRLLAQRIHPTWPDAVQGLDSSFTFERDRDGKARSLGFNTALKVLGLREEMDNIQRNLVGSLQTPRNSSYLEHGYNRLEKKTASKHFEKALLFCSILLELDSGRLAEELSSFEIALP